MREQRQSEALGRLLVRCCCPPISGAEDERAARLFGSCSRIARIVPPTSSSLAEERTPLLPPPQHCGRAITDARSWIWELLAQRATRSAYATTSEVPLGALRGTAPRSLPRG